MPVFFRLRLTAKAIEALGLEAAGGFPQLREELTVPSGQSAASVGPRAISSPELKSFTL